MTAAKPSRIKDSIGLPFTLFRGRDSEDLTEAEAMHDAPTPDHDSPDAQRVAAQVAQAMEGGLLEGSKVRLLFSRPGMSLGYAWFKSGFPLPRHSHNADCLYFIVGGSLRIGTEELGPGDGFFVGADVPYAYVPGENGVEVLEFRTADKFDIKVLANNPAWWDGALQRLADERPKWAAQDTPPSGISLAPS